MNLLRTLVKEYYTNKLENAWWKGMGYPEGKLDVMRLKINALTEARFKKEKTSSKNITYQHKRKRNSLKIA